MLRMNTVSVTSPFAVYCEMMGLVYHEARNVRHLLHAQLIEPLHIWDRLTSMPRNRYEAWSQILPLVEKAKTAESAADAAKTFVARFNCSIDDLISLYANSHWRDAAGYGGNAWKHIAKLTKDLGTAIDVSDQASALYIADKLLKASHNTGSIQQKLSSLNDSAR